MKKVACVISTFAYADFSWIGGKKVGNWYEARIRKKLKLTETGTGGTNWISQ